MKEEVENLYPKNESSSYPLTENEFIRLKAVEIVYRYHYDEPITDLSLMMPEIKKVANYIKTGKLTDGSWNK